MKMGYCEWDDVLFEYCLIIFFTQNISINLIQEWYEHYTSVEDVDILNYKIFTLSTINYFLMIIKNQLLCNKYFFESYI